MTKRQEPTELIRKSFPEFESLYKEDIYYRDLSPEIQNKIAMWVAVSGDPHSHWRNVGFQLGLSGDKIEYCWRQSRKRPVEEMFDVYMNEGKNSLRFLVDVLAQLKDEQTLVKIRTYWPGIQECHERATSKAVVHSMSQSIPEPTDIHNTVLRSQPSRDQPCGASAVCGHRSRFGGYGEMYPGSFDTSNGYPPQSPTYPSNHGSHPSNSCSHACHRLQTITSTQPKCPGYSPELSHGASYKPEPPGGRYKMEPPNGGYKFEHDPSTEDNPELTPPFPPEKQERVCRWLEHVETQNHGEPTLQENLMEYDVKEEVDVKNCNGNVAHLYMRPPQRRPHADNIEMTDMKVKKEYRDDCRDVPSMGGACQNTDISASIDHSGPHSGYPPISFSMNHSNQSSVPQALPSIGVFTKSHVPSTEQQQSASLQQTLPKQPFNPYTPVPLGDCFEKYVDLPPPRKSLDNHALQHTPNHDEEMPQLMPLVPSLPAHVSQCGHGNTSHDQTGPITGSQPVLDLIGPGSRSTYPFTEADERKFSGVSKTQSLPLERSLSPSCDGRVESAPYTDSMRQSSILVTHLYKSHPGNPTEGKELVKKVLSLGSSLKENDFRVQMDVPSRSRVPVGYDWREWLDRKFSQATYVLVCVSGPYLSLVNSDMEDPDELNTNLDSTRYLYHLMQHEIELHGVNRRFIPVYFQPPHELPLGLLPEFLDARRNNECEYVWPDSYRDLFWRLDQPERNLTFDYLPQNNGHVNRSDGEQG